MGYSQIFMFGGACGIAWIFYRLRTKKMSFDMLLEENAEFVFKTFSSASTVMEIISLSLIAIANGQEEFSSFSRYIISGGFEVLLSFFFIAMVSTQLDKKAKTGQISLYDHIQILVFSSPLFIASYVATSLIYSLYLESINVFELTMEAIHIYNPIGDINYKVMTSREINSLEGYLEEAMIAKDTILIDILKAKIPQRIQLSAMITTYCTTLVNLMLVVFLWNKHKALFVLYRNKAKDDAYKKANKETKTGKKTESDTGTADDLHIDDEDVDIEDPELDGLEGYAQLVTECFNISNTNFMNWIYEYIGWDHASNVAKIGAKTLADVKSKSMSSADALTKLTNELVCENDTTKGLFALRKHKTEISESLKQLGALNHEISNLNHELTNATQAAKINIQKDIDARRKDGNEIKTKLSTLSRGFINSQRNVKNLFQSRNLNIDTVTSSYTTEAQSIQVK